VRKPNNEGLKPREIKARRQHRKLVKLSAQHRNASLGTFGAASEVRRVDPKSGEVKR